MKHEEPTPADLAYLLRELDSVPVHIGLRAQGHLATVEQMFRDGATWDEIGAAIGWHGPTAHQWFTADLLAERDRMRAVTGPPCPSCGHYLKAEHRRSFNPLRNDIRYFRLIDTCSPPHECEIWRTDLLTNHPEIAKELGLTSP